MEAVFMDPAYSAYHPDIMEVCLPRQAVDSMGEGTMAEAVMAVAIIPPVFWEALLARLQAGPGWDFIPFLFENRSP
jgi:hypothetical protein